MANGWGGRRAGAGAPKGNNNAVRHGGYCRPDVYVDCTCAIELRRLNLALCAYQSSLPGYGEDTPFERREYYRLYGLTGWVIGKLIHLERKKSKDNLKQLKAKLHKAKVRLAKARARLLAAKTARLMKAAQS